MFSFIELSKKVEVSIGLLIALIGITAASTTAYLEVITLENRVDKRYERHEKRLAGIEAKLKINDERYIHSMEEELKLLRNEKLKNEKVIDE